MRQGWLIKPSHCHCFIFSPDENLDLRNRVAIVTGGAGGIGFEVSKRLTKLGAHVIIGWYVTSYGI